MHRLRAQHVVHDFLDGLPLPRRQLERQDLRRRRADAVVHLRHEGLELHAGRMAPPRVADLEEEELLEDHPALRRRPERVQLLDLRLVGWKVRPLERSAARQQLEARADVGRQQVWNLRRQLIQRLPDDAPLHVGRHGAGLLVERHDSRGPDRLEVVRHQLVLGVHEMQPRRVELHVAEDDDGQMRLEDVLQERLVHPRAADGAARVTNDRVKDPEPAPARHREVRALDLAEHGRTHPRPKGRDRLHVAAVFVAERKPIEQILDGGEAGALEVRGFPRTHALQKLKGGVENVGQGSMPNAQCVMLNARAVGHSALSVEHCALSAIERRQPGRSRHQSAGSTREARTDRQSSRPADAQACASSS